MIVRLFMIFALGACTNDSKRARAGITEWNASRDSVRSGSSVVTLKTPTALGRIIYDRPTNLSCDSATQERNPSLCPHARK
jgi:hypothetical protein